MIRRSVTERATSRRNVLRLLAGTSLLPLVPRLWGGRAWALESGSTEEWASGGTASMTDKASYPDPFTVALESCLIVSSTTQGPCTTANDLVREDISEGWAGLPVRLALRVVDGSCNPLQNVGVRIWHTNLEGSYSGQTPSNNFCLLQQSYAAMNFSRGVQSTDGDGKVFFDTCFPGWYRGRAIHIHFQVFDSSRSYRVSQLFLPESVTQDIFATHSDYLEFGQPDTVFANDGVMSRIPEAERERLILNVARMTDGAMLASKVVAVVDQGPPVTPSVVPTQTASPSPTGTRPVCVGDCNLGNDVTVDELVRGVNIALGNSELASCAAFDVNGSGTVTIDEVVTAVNNALNGCGG